MRLNDGNALPPRSEKQLKRMSELARIGVYAEFGSHYGYIQFCPNEMEKILLCLRHLKKLLKRST